MFGRRLMLGFNHDGPLPFLSVCTPRITESPEGQYVQGDDSMIGLDSRELEGWRPTKFKEYLRLSTFMEVDDSSLAFTNLHTRHLVDDLC